jgi:molybdate transport repressor ModE-like protein
MMSGKELDLMEINDLIIFKTVVHEGSISKAAKELGYVQQNVTERIKKLEQELETKLLHRESKGVSILPSGGILLDYTEKILQLLDKAKMEIKMSSEPYRIATTQTILSNYLSDRIKDNFKDYQIYMESSSRLEYLLKKQQVDMIITYGNYSESSIQKVFCTDIPMGLLIAKGKAAIDYSNELFFVSHDVHCPFRNHTIDFLKQHTLSKSQLHQVDSYSLMKEFVAQRKGVAFLPINNVEAGKIEVVQIDKIPIYFFTSPHVEKIIPRELFG